MTGKEFHYKSVKKWSARRPVKSESETIKSQAPDGFLRALVDACVTSVAVVDESGMVLYASKAWRSFEQNAVPKRRGHVSQRFITSCVRERASVTLADDIEAILTGSEKEFHRRYYHPSHAKQQPFLIHGARLDLPGSIIRVLISHEDVRLNSEASHDLSGRLLAAQEEERKRVARELHDDLNQRLGLVAIELRQLEGDIEDGLIRRQLERTREHVQQISADVHGLSYKLHPSKLEHLGLARAVKGLCKEISQTGKLKVNFLERDVPDDVPTDISLCLFRIAQELLGNCVKHSGAQCAQVYLRGTNNRIGLLVSDNGCGFDPRAAQMKKGLGFVSIKERVRLAGGELRINSQPDHGTRIHASVPLNHDITRPAGASRPQLTTSLLSSIESETPDGGEKGSVITT